MDSQIEQQFFQYLSEWHFRNPDGARIIWDGEVPSMRSAPQSPDMQPLCQICCNAKRRLRFHTEQLAICQWCVTELSTTATSPARILDERRLKATSTLKEVAERELARLIKLRMPVPQLSTATIESATTYAEAVVRRDESLLQSIFRSMVDDKKRREQVSAVAARRRDELLAAHREATSTHQCQQQKLEARISSAEATLRLVPEAVEQEIQKLANEVKLIAPTKSKEIRLLRAFHIGLIDFERTQHARPEQSEYEEQKRRIRERDSFRCVCCLRGFSQGELHVHHVLPLFKYGTNLDSNLVTLCHPCHNKQHPDIQVTRSFPIKRRPPTARFIAVDVETTGLSKDDSIIEIAAVRFVGGQAEQVFCSLVRTKRVISPQIERLTGISQAMISAAPHPEAVMRDFVAFVSDHRLVFHNASFDMRFIGKYLEYYGHSLPDRILDTLPLARRKLPTLSSHRLANLVQHLGLPVMPSHRAQDDSLATGHLYLALRDIPSPRPKKKRKRPAVQSSKQFKATKATHGDA